MQNFKSGNCRLLLLWDGWIGGGKSVEGIVHNYSRYLKLTYLTNIDNKYILKFTAPHYESRRLSGLFLFMFLPRFTAKRTRSDSCVDSLRLVRSFVFTHFKLYITPEVGYTEQSSP